jgi:hypothetical protein
LREIQLVGLLLLAVLVAHRLLFHLELLQVELLLLAQVVQLDLQEAI